MKGFWGELRRRKVVRTTIVYLLGAWVLLQVGDTIIGLAGFPEWTGRALLVSVSLGLPLAIAFSWIFDFTPTVESVADDARSAGATEFTWTDPESLDFTELPLTLPRVEALVCRSREREVLAGCLDEAAEGKGGVLLIGGEPGVGKTRLGEEAVIMAQARGMLPLVGHAYDDHTTPMIVAIEMLEEAMRVLPDTALRNALGPAAPEVARLVPDLRLNYPGIPEPAELPPEQQQRYFFNGVLRFLGRLSDMGPVVLLFDDLHWAEESSTQLFEHLAAQVTRLPILMVVTYRDIETDMSEPFRLALGRLSRDSQVTRIGLRRFSHDDVFELLQTLSGHKPPAGVVNSIFEHTNGNVFFVKSVYQHLSEEGLLFDQNGVWLEGTDPELLEVPDSVRLVTGRRIAKLDQATQDTLNIAAVMGLRFSLPLLEAVSGNADGMIDCIEQAERAQLIKRSGSERELRYEFVHALARQAVLGELSALRRQKLHQVIAKSIETMYQDSLDAHAADLAFHLTRAGGLVESGEVARWLTVAGKNALASLAVEEAVDYFRRSLEILGKEITLLRAETLHLCGRSRMSLGNVNEVQDDLDSAISLYHDLGQPDLATQVAVELANVYIWTAQPGKADKLVQRGLDLASDKNTVDRCKLISIRALAHSYQRRPDDPATAKALHQQAVAMARELDDPELLADVLLNQGLDCWVRLDSGAAEVGHEAAGIWRDAGEHWKLCQCLWSEIAGLSFAGRFEEAAKIDRELVEFATLDGNYGSLGCAWLLTSTIELSRGDILSASKALETSTQWFEAGNFPWGKYNAGYDAIIQLLAGNRQQARAAIDKVGAELIEGIVWSGAQHGYWLSAKAQMGDRDILDQYRQYEYNLPQANTEMSAGAVIFLKGAIEALVLAGEDGEAARLYPLINEFVERGLGHSEFVFGIHDRFAGMAAAAAQDPENTHRHYQKALELADAFPHRVDQARVRYWYARSLLDLGEPNESDRAQELLEGARAHAVGTGMPGLIEAIEQLESG